MSKNNPDIFLSRSWRNHKEADEILSKLQEYDIDLTEDVRDSPYENNLPELTKRALNADWVIVLLSAEYLESLNCASQIARLANKRNNGEKTIFITLPGLKSTLKANGRKYYVEYWTKEKQKLEKEKQNATSETVRQNITQASQKVEEIISSVIRLLPDANKDNNIEFDKFKKNCRPLINALGSAAPELTRKAEQKLGLEETIKNEQKKLKIIARNKIRSLRKKAFDQLMLKKTGILETPLKTLEKKEGLSQVYQETSQELEEMLNSREPLIIFGRSGQGKTILSTVIAEKILNLKKQIPYFVCVKNVLARLKTSDIYDIILGQDGIADLTPQTLESVKFCFIIDDCQRLISEFEKETLDAAARLRNEGHQVALFFNLRARGASAPKPTIFSGYRSVIIDSSKIASAALIDKFIKTRLGDSKDRERIKKALARYDEDTRASRQTLRFLSFLLTARNKNPERLKNRVGDPESLKKLLSGKPLSKFEIYDAFSDYTFALEAIKNKKNIKFAKDKKEKLAQKAFNDIFPAPDSDIKGLKASFPLYKNGKKPEFANNSLRDFFLAKYFIDRVNSGTLPVEEAYNNYWSYAEDSRLWGFPKDREWRALLPDWEETLMMIIEKLKPGKAESLLDIIGKNYREFDKFRKKDQYNPFVENENILCRLAGRKAPIVKKLSRRMLSELAEAPPEEQKIIVKRLKEMGCRDPKMSTFKAEKPKSSHKTKNSFSDAKQRESHEFAPEPSRQDYFKLKTANVLGEIGHYDPRLSELLKDENWKVRKSAAEALAKTGHYDPELIKLLKDKNFYVRKSAAEALGKIKRHDPALIEFLKDENPETRWRAANILGEIKRYAPELTTLFEDEDARVRWSVIDALGKMKRYDPKLLESLKDENIGVRRRAADALKEIAAQKIIEDYQKVYGLKSRVMENSILEDVHQAIKPVGRNPADKSLRNHTKQKTAPKSKQPFADKN